MKLNFSDEEISQLIKSWAAISLAFTIAGMAGVGPAGRGEFVQSFLISAVTVGLAFLLHELAHKFVAQYFGCWAEFRSFDMGLILAVIMSFTGYVFAAPGAVMVGGVVSTSENGKISVAGPLTNIALALIFLAIREFVPVSGLAMLVVQSGIFINAWLTVFNMIPIWNLDGAKVFRWNIPLGIIVMVTGIFLLTV